jgi:hypothetical protein
LHRPPPDILTLESSFDDFSRMAILSLGFLCAALMAPKKPAAPPPITTKSNGLWLDKLCYLRIVTSLMPPDASCL